MVSLTKPHPPKVLVWTKQAPPVGGDGWDLKARAAALKCFIRKNQKSSAVAEKCDTYRTPALAEGRRATPARCWNNCCNKCLHSSYSGAATQTQTVPNDACEGHLRGGAHLPACDGKLLLALLAVSSFIIFEPGVALTPAKRKIITHSLIECPKRVSGCTFSALLTSLKSSIFSLDL